VPRNVTLRVPRGALLSVNAGITLTLNGPVIADDPDWYSGAGTVTFGAIPFGSEERFHKQWTAGYVIAGGLHATSGTTTTATFACEAVSSDGRHWTQSAAAVTYSGGDGTYWLIGHKQTTTALSGWTRQSGTHYLWKVSTTLPALPSASVLLLKVTVAASAVSVVRDFRQPLSYVTRGVFEVTDALYGADRTDTTDATTALQAALTACGDQGGGTGFLPPGTYKTTAPLLIYKSTTLRGAGYHISFIHTAHSGDAVQSTWPVNASTAVWIRVEHLGFTSTASTGAAFVDRGGSLVDVYAVWVSGHAYGVIFDQTEIATIDASIFDGQSITGVWLVNGPDHDATATNYNWTNRITVSRNQFNTVTTAGHYNMVDDGGVAHTICNNNFNGGLQNLRVCGSEGATISGNEFESSSSTCLTFQNTTLAGSSHASIIDPRGVLVSGNVFAPVLGNIQIDFLHAYSVTLLSNFFGSDSTSPGRVKNTNIDTLIAIGNEFRGGPSNGGTFTGGATNGLFLNGSDLVGAVAVKPGLQLPNPGTATTGISTKIINTWYEEGTFAPTLVASGSTFSLAVNGQKGHYTRMGNVVHYTIYLELAAGGNTLTTQAVRIDGLPFTSAAGTNRVTTTGACVWGGFNTAAIGIMGRIVEGTTQIRLYIATAAAASATLMQADAMAGSAFLHVSGTYYAA